MDEQQRSLEWYGKLHTRRVDLVGDYAGNELFVVEGDSLLLKCFNDPKLDFDAGFQLLHAVYNVEHFLQNLRQRRCNFHIVFFDDHESLCVPPKTASHITSKFLLARAAIKRHLEANVVDLTLPRIELHTFKSTSDEAFAKYLWTTGVYFVMCHDGAFNNNTQAPSTSDHRVSDLAQSEESETSRKARFRGMILLLLSRGYNIALINGLEWQDTKVMTEVVEGHRLQKYLTPLINVHTSVPTESPSSSPIEGKPGLDHVHALQSLQDLVQNREISRGHGGSGDVHPGKWTQRRCIITVAMDMMLAKEATQRTLVAAFLEHAALLEVLPLASRRLKHTVVDAKSTSEMQHFIDESASTMCSLLQDISFHRILRRTAKCDLSDLLDGRLFSSVLAYPEQLAAHRAQIKDILEEYAIALHHLSGNHIELLKSTKSLVQSTESQVIEDQRLGSTILPFSNYVFDKHLAPIKLTTSSKKRESPEAGRIFQEVSHWHNARRPLSKAATPLTPWEKKKVARRHNFFMAEMQAYAASLTNATGSSLEPETVTVGTKVLAEAQPDVAKENASPARSKPSKPDQSSKSKNKPSKKQNREQDLAVKKAEKDDFEANKTLAAWQIVRKNLEAEVTPARRYQKLSDYLRDRSDSQQRVLGAEVQFHMICDLVEILKGYGPSSPEIEPLSIMALLWTSIRKIMETPGLTKTIVHSLKAILDNFHLPKIEMEMPPSDRAFAYDPKLTLPRDNPPINPHDDLRFQLLYCGPYMDRNLDSAPDPRVPFEPDGWQRAVLDELDAERSLFIVAPTSAGKTFISFYAMEKILRSNDESVLVYVAPTKALVNQIAAEIQARFRKSFRHPGKSVWAIHTRDYRVNNPLGCQVLVTVPHILQIMLLSPKNAKSWSTRIRYIIFDEIHSIGQAEDGVVWEQLLLLAPCPLIALSATVGNPEKFSSWLSDIQESSGRKLTTIQHAHRYSDLRKFIYRPPKNPAFNGLTEKTTFGILGLDNIDDLAFMHPVASLVNRSRGMPPDLSLEARDCLLLYDAMAKHQDENFPVKDNLSPTGNLRANIVRKADIIQWEAALKEVLQQWMDNDNSPFSKVVEDLSRPLYGSTEASASEKEPSNGESVASGNTLIRQSDSQTLYLYQTTLPLLYKLHERNALPAIIFNYDRSKCVGICGALIQQLEDAESSWKESNAGWKNKLKGFEQWKKLKAKADSKKPTKQASKKKGNEGDNVKEDKMLDAQSDDSNPYAGFDPEDPVDGYHFANKSKAEASELQDYFKELRRREVPEMLLTGLMRGIGVHHAGMNRKYRQTVEVLFRKGYLRVVIATGTLALGINMPCATVVFSGDSVFLTALNFRQAAGRAGRRGFDLLGNVVFHGLSEGKVCRLLSSRLPDLNGHFPITTTLVLRLFTLLHDSDNSRYATEAIKSMMSQPRLYLDGPSFRDQVLHHLRFSIEYLRRQDLLSTTGAPINFAGLTSHLYFTENSSFALNALIKGGYFHELCAEINSRESHVLRSLMLVLAHLFGRHPCRQADAEYLDKVKNSSSIVFLPPMPSVASKVLRQHNKDTLETFMTYVRTFIEQHMVGEDDNVLPLTGLVMGSQDKDYRLQGSLPAPQIRSSFVALSGHGDNFNTISELCRTTRNGVFLEEAVIPYVELHPEESTTPLNAYLYDFFMHGDVKTLERANGVRAGDVWFVLNDFSLVLKTIVASLANFLKLSETDLNFEDLAGEGDERENLQDESIADDSTVASESTVSTQTSGVATPLSSVSSSTTASQGKTKKKQLADSWDDNADDDDEEEDEKDDDDVAAAKMANLDLSKAELEKGFLNIYKAMGLLTKEFNTKFYKMFA